MSAALLPRIRAHGADVVLRDGRPVVRQVSRLPAVLMADAKARRADLLAELLAERPANQPDASDAAHDATERAAMQAEATGNAAAPVPHHLPESWADMRIAPTAGARCRNCAGRDWWTEATAPRGWRCGRCHPGDHLPAEQRREVQT